MMQKYIVQSHVDPRNTARFRRADCKESLQPCVKILYKARITPHNHGVVRQIVSPIGPNIADGEET